MRDDPAAGARAFRPWAEALYGALAEDPFYRALEESAETPPGGREAMLRYYEYSLLEAQRYGHVQCAEGAVGAAIWSVPLSGADAAARKTEKSAVLLSHMGRASLDTYLEICGLMERATAPFVAETDWYLSILGLAPSHQGKGLGAGVIRPVLEKADALGVATYLETFTPRSKAFYARLGYATVGSADEPLTKCPYWVMRRPPGR